MSLKKDGNPLPYSTWINAWMMSKKIQICIAKLNKIKPRNLKSELSKERTIKEKLNWNEDRFENATILLK